MKNFILAITFLTRIYIPNKYAYNEEDFGKSTWYYPVVGIILGAILGGAAFILNSILPNTDLTAFLILILYVGLSGGLHLDGLADVCDGIFSSRSREKIFDIMKDSRVGTFGVIGLVLYFLGMWVALKQANWQVVFLFPIVGRCTILITAGLSNYAKESGLGKSIVEATHVKHIVYSVLVAFIASMLLGGIYLVLPVLLTFLVVLVLTKRISKILLGITGDVMGMMVEVSQVVFLLSAVVLGQIGARL